MAPWLRERLGVLFTVQVEAQKLRRMTCCEVQVKSKRHKETGADTWAESDPKTQPSAGIEPEVCGRQTSIELGTQRDEYESAMVLGHLDERGYIVRRIHFVGVVLEVCPQAYEHAERSAKQEFVDLIGASFVKCGRLTRGFCQ